MTAPRLAVLAAACCLLAPASGAQAAASAWVGDGHAAARLVSATEATGSAPYVDAGIEIRLAPGWHTYWRSPGDAGIPPRIDWKGSQNLAGAQIAWPAPRRVSLLGFETAAYEKDVILPVTVSLARPGAALALRADVDYAACAQICVPYHAQLSLDLPAGLAVPGGEAERIARFAALVPQSATEAGLRLSRLSVVGAAARPLLRLRLDSLGAPFRAPDLFVEGADPASFGRPEIRLAEAGRSAVLTVPVRQAKRADLVGKPLTLTLVDGGRAAELRATAAPGVADSAIPGRLWAILGLALLGGFILNAMPCVLPVLSLKFLGIAGYAGAERRHVRAGFAATALGILFSFLLLAGALILLRAGGAAIGWGIQFQQPWFLVAMIALLSLFAANLWDWFAVPMPGFAQTAAVSAPRHPLVQSFLTGVFATLLATPCSAPFVGTAVGFALGRGAGTILAVFLGLGLGFALPYLAVAAAPGIARLLPRPGRWLIVLRRVLGLSLLVTAAWLGTVLAADSGPRAAVALGILMALLLAVLAWRSRVSGVGTPRHRALSALAAGLVALAFAVPLLAPRVPAEASAAASRWQPFNLDRLDRLVAQGRTVFVDVTADWCLTCKLNKAAVLDRGPVAAWLSRPQVVAMRADWTRPDPAIGAYLQSFQRYGIPFDAVYGPKKPQGVPLPVLLTTDAVVEALRAASVDKTASAR
ncbi:MAG TPA: protein-disulfide reductase DsbD domain-containing protein [Stellaceae bacterium]|nr:protein-disulfide reductase DsbD domain-containing protein [Stellaceae bacterium]